MENILYISRFFSLIIANIDFEDYLRFVSAYIDTYL